MTNWPNVDKGSAAFAVVSVMFLIALAIAPFKDYFREWKRYQHEYNLLIGTLPSRIKPAAIGIRQLWTRKLDRIDRCITCHLGLKEKALAESSQPFRTHPRMHHDSEEFGCTICHEGQGAATTYEESVGKVKYWDRPMLPKEFVEASCGKCHKETRVPHAPILTLGRKLIEESNCIGCHKLQGFGRQWVPSLDGIGSKVNRTWLVRWLKDPKAYAAKTRMPNFMFSDEDAGLLADFLMTFRSFPSGATLESLPVHLSHPSPSTRDKLVELGSTRFREARCISCHPINGKGGTVATDLGKVASKAHPQWLYNYLKSPKRLQPGVEMPRFRLTENELTAVVAYIQSELIDYEMEAAAEHVPDPAFYEKGMMLFKKYNCSGCHELGGMTRAEEMGPDLVYIGDKKLYEIDFGNAGIEHTLPLYLLTKLESPRAFLPSMKMPKYGFTDEEARAVAVALLGNTSEDIPGELRVLPKQPSTFTPQGDFGKLVDDLACFGCHTMFGRGRLVATDLTQEASQAQRDWIKSYFKIPYSLRPILTERMPNLFLGDGEIKVIVDYMEKVLIADSLDQQLTIDRTKITRGRTLFYEKFGCQGCHQINLKGGYVGPALDRVGSRLRAGWIMQWLRDPQALNPNTIEPNNGMAGDEVEAVTAFLISLL